MSARYRDIAAWRLGRPLKRWEVVHHLDGRHEDDHPDNLRVLPGPRAHALLHWYQRRKACSTCSTSRRGSSCTADTIIAVTRPDGSILALFGPMSDEGLSDTALFATTPNFYAALIRLYNAMDASEYERDEARHLTERAVGMVHPTSVENMN